MILPVMALMLAAAPAMTPGWAGAPASGIYYESAGKGPAIILIHGGQMDRRIWDPQVAPFAERFRVIRYDVRGYGKSPTPKAPYSDVEDLLAVMEAAGVKKARLVGLSLGGRIAVDFALAHPDRVDALILAGPGISGWEWSQATNERTLAVKEAVKSKDPKRITEAWLAHDYMRQAMKIPDLVPTLRRLTEENVPAWLMDDSLNRDNALKAVEHLEEIQPPTFLMVGQLDVPDIQMICRRVGSLARFARRMLFRGAGHILNMEQPEEFNRAVMAFIDSVGEGEGIQTMPAPAPSTPR